ncbi:MAG: 2-hydroxyglutaryl-CoA dehydratase, partial [Tissierellales bacterium]
MSTRKCYLGIDLGSVSINVVLMDDDKRVLNKIYVRTEGKPILVLKRILNELYEKLDKDIVIAGVGATGSGRDLAAAMVGADVVKNEITAHGVAALTFVPGART